MNEMIGNDSLVLFQGDSITAAGRGMGSLDDLGRGYALMAAGWFMSQFPEKHVKFINRGVGGNRIRDLQARWDADCLDLKPDVVSIYIGINDTWRRYDRNEPTPVDQFAESYRDLLIRTAKSLDARIMMVEPFLLPVSGEQQLWREDLDPKINAVRELAREFDARLVPLDGVFAQASARAPSGFWVTDGVHPSPAGHALIARAWLNAAGIPV